MRPEEVERRFLGEAEIALRVIAEDLLGRAQRDAPVEEGTLRGSGSVDVQRLGGAVTATVSFSTPYAAKQHEETTYQHPRGGKSKFLEDNLKGLAPRYEAFLAGRLRRIF